MTSDSTTVGETVKRERRARGWTQEQLAEITKLGVRTVQRLETLGIAGLTTLRRVAEALDMTVEQLQERKTSSAPPSTDRAKHKLEVFPRLVTGNDIASIVSGAEMYQHDHDPLELQEEVELVSGFLQDLQDYGDLWGDLDSGDRVKATFALHGHLTRLEAGGFAAFGLLVQRRVRFPYAPEPNELRMSISVVVVLRSSNARIVRVDGAEFLPALY